MSVNDYPPVPGPGAQQASWALSHGKIITEEEWNSWTFSEAFKARYGVPVTYWSHWCKLTTFSCRVELLSDPPMGTSFVYFCKDIDTKCERHGCKTPERMEMEALYTQSLLRWFDKEETANDVKRDLSRNGMILRLNEGAERYWLKKQELFNLSKSSIARLDEEAGEPESERSNAFEDYDRMEVELGAQSLSNQAKVSRKDKQKKNVQSRPKTKTLKKVKPVKIETKRSRRTARKAMLMATVEAMTSASMVAMNKSLKAFKRTSAATKGEKRALRGKKIGLMKKIRAEVAREGEKAVQVKAERAVQVKREKEVQVKSEQTRTDQVAVAHVAAAAPTRHESMPSWPPYDVGMRTLTFRPR